MKTIPLSYDFWADMEQTRNLWYQSSSNQLYSGQLGTQIIDYYHALVFVYVSVLPTYDYVNNIDM